MSHTHMLSNQQQLTMNPLVSSAATQQHSGMSQRGQDLVPPKTGYQIQSVPMSHLQQQPLAQQQPQLVNSYHNQKQLFPDISSAHQYSSSVASMPTQNGGYQTLTGSSRHSSLGLENPQLGVQHQTPQHHQYQQQPPIQPGVQQHHYQPQQTISQPQQQTQPPQQQHILQSMQQKHHHLLQQQQQIQIQPQQQIPQQPTYQQQHLQIQQQLQQRSLHQQQRYQKLQAKQILQQQPTTPKTVSSQVQQPTQLDTPQHQEITNPVTIPNCHAATAEERKEDSIKIKVKSENEPSEESKNNAAEKLCLANTKEKTPMCLINELVRFNKISHQYTLVDEQGPAHKKTFYVKLKLADEEYSASGESIKKAQHSAAASALIETKYPHPPPKPARISGGSSVDSGDDHITPTVELNALAMKLGDTVTYKAIEPQQPPYYHQPGVDFQGFCNQRYHNYMPNRDPHYYGSGVLWPLRYNYTRMSRAFYVSLRVGQREFIGDGPTRQMARHNAAQKALRILKNLPVQNNTKKDEEQKEEQKEEEKTNDNLKSEISLVHEIALHRNMPITFEVIREAGPPHMKNFVTKCTVADKLTEGDGNSKKASKKKAAELMLEELRKLPPSPAPAVPKPMSKIKINKKKNRNLIKSELQQQKADPNYGVGINPISRLIQIMQAQKKKEPVYTLIAERGLPRRREFIMQVEVENKSCTGTGPNKKLAKRAAAESMLQVLGYTKPSPQPAKSSIKHPVAAENIQNGDKKVTFVEGNAQTENTDNISCDPHNTSCDQVAQQKVPGLQLIPNNNSTKLAVNFGATSRNLPSQGKEFLINLANILKPNLRPEVQLRKLCKTLGYEIEIDDFTKKHLEGTEHIARITIGQEQPQSFHGSSSTVESSRDNAALDALKVLLATVKDIHQGGDGPQVEKDQVFRSSPGLKKTISK